MLDRLKSRLLETTGSVIDASVADIPGRFSDSLHEMTEHNYHLELSLLACASSMWCGTDEYIGMPAAVGSLLLRAGVIAHLGTCGLPDVFNISSATPQDDETLAILAGDGLLALAMEYLAGNCGRHSSRLVSEAVKAVGASGMLEGLSLQVDSFSGVEVIVPDGRTGLELYTGQLARFASHGGALLAGASGMMLDDAAQIGLLTGRARHLSTLAESDANRHRKSELIFQARTLTEQAQSIAGHKDNSTLFNSLMYLSDFF